jgi:CDP-glucose 4,6-dehydratase
MEQEPKKYANAYNFGPVRDVNLTVEELVKLAFNIMGKGDYIHSEVLTDKHEANLLHLDVSRAVDELGWTPKLSAEKAVSLTMQWYKEYKADPYAITFRQIVEYFNS